MLDVLLGEGICNVLVVVTRYFGGTLLGTGGLVRAYSQAVQAGLAKSTVIEKIYGVRMQIHTDYNGVGKIQYLLGQRKIPILCAEYTDKVRMEVMIPAGDAGKLQAEITEGMNGRARMEISENLYFAVNEGELIYHDALTRYKNLEA